MVRCGGVEGGDAAAKGRIQFEVHTPKSSCPEMDPSEFLSRLPWRVSRNLVSSSLVTWPSWLVSRDEICPLVEPRRSIRRISTVANVAAAAAAAGCRMSPTEKLRR